MASLAEKTSSGREYMVKDMSPADFGRLKIELAEVKMPDLMACRAKYGPSQPFKGAKITVALHMTIQTAVLIETLTALGAEVRWCSCSLFSTQDHAAAAAVAMDSAAFFAWQGETLQEYWVCTERALDWGPGGCPDLIVDDGGDATLLIQEGVKAEEIYEKTGQLPDPASTDNAEFQIVLTIIRDGLKTDPRRYHKVKERLVDVSEETTTGVKRLYQMHANGTLLFPAITVNDSVTKIKVKPLRQGSESHMGYAENQLLIDLLEYWLAENPNVAGFKRDGISNGCSQSRAQFSSGNSKRKSLPKLKIKVAKVLASFPKPKIKVDKVLAFGLKVSLLIANLVVELV